MYPFRVMCIACTSAPMCRAIKLFFTFQLIGSSTSCSRIVSCILSHRVSVLHISIPRDVHCANFRSSVSCHKSIFTFH
ncbi:hypothetical protein DFS34DRAFT_163249 [Phlyctochytrium arcticum]|nr:hypothetical protein DFS34DRAFT_163249 [Phlyctochytrium arcticum]